MRLSELFFATLRDDPGEAEMPSHRLLLRAGYVRQLGSGIYSLLPLGKRVSDRVEQVIREEQNRIGGQELEMPVVHVEAGLRSFNRAMPEEINRVVTDHLSASLLCASAVAAHNLALEGISSGVELVGDVLLERRVFNLACAFRKLSSRASDLESQQLADSLDPLQRDEVVEVGLDHIRGERVVAGRDRRMRRKDATRLHLFSCLGKTQPFGLDQLSRQLERQKRRLVMIEPPRQPF